jgi:hypothetical protein
MKHVATIVRFPKSDNLRRDMYVAYLDEKDRPQNVDNGIRNEDDFWFYPQRGGFGYTFSTMGGHIPNFGYGPTAYEALTSLERNRAENDAIGSEIVEVEVEATIRREYLGRFLVPRALYEKACKTESHVEVAGMFPALLRQTPHDTTITVSVEEVKE